MRLANRRPGIAATLFLAGPTRALPVSEVILPSCQLLAEASWFGALRALNGNGLSCGTPVIDLQPTR